MTSSYHVLLPESAEDHEVWDRKRINKKKHLFNKSCAIYWTSLVTQLVKNLPAMQETWVQFLGLEDSLEKRKATHSSILAWRIPWTEEPGQL